MGADQTTICTQLIDAIFKADGDVTCDHLAQSFIDHRPENYRLRYVLVRDAFHYFEAALKRRTRPLRRVIPPICCYLCRLGTREQCSGASSQQGIVRPAGSHTTRPARSVGAHSSLPRPSNRVRILALRPLFGQDRELLGERCAPKSPLPGSFELKVAARRRG